MVSSSTPSITIYRDEDNVPIWRENNRRTLDKMDITPSSASPSQCRTPLKVLRTPIRTRTPFANLNDKTESISTPKDSQIASKTEAFSGSNETASSNKRFKNDTGQIVNMDSYKKRIKQLEAELSKQIDENQKQSEENQKSYQEIEMAFEKAKCAALGYKNELYGPVYVDGDYTSINKLLRHLDKVAGQGIINRFKEETLVDGELPTLNLIFTWLEESGFLKYEILKEFRAVNTVESLNLTYTFEKIKRVNCNVYNSLEPIEPQNLNQNMQNANRLMSVFNLPYSFQHLKSLRLSFIPIEDSCFNNFRSLKNLEELVIDYTGIGNEALVHLIALKDNLCFLNITGNMKINDDSVLILIHFEKLKVLLLDDTSISMDGIREFVFKTTSTDLSQIFIPSPCRKYLSKRKEIYCVEHKQGMKVDPLEVKFMSLSEIRQQLMFHYRVNNNIDIVGSKEELEESLREILKQRRNDARAMLLTRLAPKRKKEFVA